MCPASFNPTGLKCSFHKFTLGHGIIAVMGGCQEQILHAKDCPYLMNSENQTDLWRAAYYLLQQSILPNQLQAWIQPLEWMDSETTENELTVRLTAPNDFAAQWVRDHFKENIESALLQVSGMACKVQFIGRENPEKDDFLEPVSMVKMPIQANKFNPLLSVGQSTNKNHAIDSRYTFDTFVVGASNQFAYASAVAVGEKPGDQYNPLFIYSSPGLGKTHLLHAIGNYFLTQNKNCRVMYLSAENFVNELIENLRHKKMHEFRAKFRDGYDVLLIDDIQFIAGKQASEEEFFHTFNTLYALKKQIVLTSDRPPKEIKNLEERILTRFEWGLVADIQPPEIETRIAILRAKAEQDDVYLPDEIATFLATHVKSNVRELEGILIRLQAQASLTGAEISIEMAKDALKTILPEESSHLTVESIQSAVASYFHLRVHDLKSTTRTKTVALARQISMYLIRKYTSLGFKEIGQCFGGKDHTTILYACNKIEKACEEDPATQEMIEKIQNRL